MPKISIIIPSLGRPKSLEYCVSSFQAQPEEKEIIVVTEEGPLARIRNSGARRASGDILLFVDDDVVSTPDHLSSIRTSFGLDKSIGGVTGPAIIRSEYRANRDLFRYKWIKKIHDLVFMDGYGRSRPAHFSTSGAISTKAADEDCFYDGPCEYLEACNMAVRRDVFEKVGGFDESYKGVGDWSEPDLAFAIRKMGFPLWFNRNAAVYHFPSRSGAYGKRETDRTRLSNYLLFSERHIRPCFKHSLYKLFIRSYYGIKTLERQYHNLTRS